MSQAERDRLEEERIARARAERDAALSGRTASLVRHSLVSFSCL